MKHLYLFFLFLCIPLVEAKEIRFPDEELAPESVLPVFENNKKVTMNRRVQLKHKLGLSGSFLGRMDEPFLYPVTFSGALEFFFNETHGVRVSGFYFWPGVSSRFVSALSELKREKKTVFDPGKIHHPQYGFFFSYALAPFYGKISLATNIVANLNLSIYFGLGALALDLDYRRYPSNMQWTYAGLVEFSQKVFIGRRFYLHGSLSFMIYRAPNPIWCRDVQTRGANVPYDSCDHYANRRDVMPYEKSEMDILFRTIVGGGFGVLFF